VIEMISPIPSRPDATEYASPFEAYVKLVPQGDIITHLEQQIEGTVTLLRDVSESVADTRHAPYTWSIKEVVGQLIDSERIFGVRALCFARQDQNELPGFDENDYVRHARFDARQLGSLVQEFELVRRSHILFFRGLDDEAWRRSGVANGHRVTVRALAYIIAGHERHHVTILRERLSR
jgi:DinB superfamily